MKNLTQAQKHVHCKQSTIFVLESWNFVTMASLEVGNINLSTYLKQNCGFFTMKMFLGSGQVFHDSLYLKQGGKNKD